MKVTLKYEEGDDRELYMTLRLTLPPKYIEQPTKAVVRLFVDHYNKKHEAKPLDAESLHLKVVGGNHVDRDAVVNEALSHNDECYLMDANSFVSCPAKRPAATSTAAAVKPRPPAASSDDSCRQSKVVKDEKGNVRCKRFGCNRFFDPDGEPQECVHHKSPPIFHEVAKWWSCCPNKKAYDWEEFMRIPGCEKGFCSATPEGQGEKRHLGGSDLRAEAAPVRLDGPPEARQLLTQLRRGLVAIGVDGDLFDQVWGRLHAQSPNDPDAVVRKLRARFSTVLSV